MFSFCVTISKLDGVLAKERTRVRGVEGMYAEEFLTIAEKIRRTLM